MARWIAAVCLPAGLVLLGLAPLAAPVAPSRTTWVQPKVTTVCVTPRSIAEPCWPWFHMADRRNYVRGSFGFRELAV